MASLAPIYSLPNELVYEIASKTIAHSRGTSISSDLINLASASKRLRSITLPIVLRDVRITSASKLLALSRADREPLSMIQSLIIELDLEFFEQWAYAFDGVHFPYYLPNSRPPIVFAFALLLSKTLSLRNLEIRFTPSTDPARSPWSQFPRAQLAGVSFGKSFESACAKLNLPDRFCWEGLTTIHIDAMTDLGPLLRRSPNLASLHLDIPEGFSTRDCSQFLRDIAAYVPNLIDFAMSPFSMAIPGGENLLGRIGAALQDVQSVDLRTRSFCHSNDRTVLRQVTSPMSGNPEQNRLSAFPHLNDISLPFDVTQPSNTRGYLPRSNSRSTIQTPHPEISRIFSSNPKLRNFSWISNELDSTDPVIYQARIASGQLQVVRATQYEEDDVDDEFDGKYVRPVGKAGSFWESLASLSSLDDMVCVMRVIWLGALGICVVLTGLNYIV